MLYRASTVREMQRRWERERLLYLRKIDDLLAAVLMANGRPVAESLLHEEREPSGYPLEELAAMRDFATPDLVYDDLN